MLLLLSRPPTPIDRKCRRMLTNSEKCHKLILWHCQMHRVHGLIKNGELSGLSMHESFMFLRRRKKQLWTQSVRQSSSCNHKLATWIQRICELGAPVLSPCKRTHYKPALTATAIWRIWRLRVHLRFHQNNFIITNLLWHFISICCFLHTLDWAMFWLQQNVCLRCLTCLIEAVSQIHMCAIVHVCVFT